MPVKRRASKRRRLSPEAELEAWRETFCSGFDFFDLLPLGLEGDAAFALDREKPAPGDVEVLVAAREAWARLGAAFLATWKPQAYLPEPWTLTAFGKPEGRGRAY
jgi:hypothetical protein